MSIQWYPGHMRKARRAIAETMPSQDVVIEVLDARMPRASENPVVTELRGAKPCVKVLTKSDLADPEVTAMWLQYLERQGASIPGAGGAQAANAVSGPNGPNAASGPHASSGRIIALAVTTDRASDARARITEACAALAVPTRGRKTARAMIIGIPNVGKSTLVNTLAQRKVANVGDEPAVTKSEQVVVMKNGMTLSDNPGILWPKIEDPTAALRLALGGAIPDAALDYEGVALFGAGVFLERYPGLLAKRYKLTTMPADAESLLLEIGRRRGCIRSGGVVDRHKAADVLIHDFRDGVLGRISLERPTDPESIQNISASSTARSAESGRMRDLESPDD